MTGDFLKKKIEDAGFQLNAIAKKINITPQNLHSKLSAQDIRVSFLIEIANAINKPVEYFFDEHHLNKEYSLSINSNTHEEINKLRNECYEKGNRIIALLDENSALRKELEEIKKATE